LARTVRNCAPSRHARRLVRALGPADLRSFMISSRQANHRPGRVIGARSDGDTRTVQILHRPDHDRERRQSEGNLVGAREAYPAAARACAHRRAAGIGTCRSRDWTEHWGGSCLGPEWSIGIPPAAKLAGWRVTAKV
jgi:hypothetical protein